MAVPLGNPYYLTIAKTSSNPVPPISKSGLVDIFNWVDSFKLVSSIQLFFSGFGFSLQSQPGISGGLMIQTAKENQDVELPCRELTSKDKAEDEKLCRQDVEMVMERMGIFCNPEDEKLQESLGSDELSRLFEEEEPTLEEVKEAFHVFDENRDGFIDARKLQRVLCKLGFKEGSELENCNRMIEAFDENGDGRIDFSEFVKFMENSLC